jgi:hypothetical protein
MTGHTWQLDVETNIPHEPVTIRFVKSANSPDSIYFVDEALKNLKLMKDSTDFYQFISGSGSTLRKFRIIAGTQQYLSSSTSDITLTASNFALHPIYPNPFINITNIYYTIAQENRVNIEIYNVLGQCVRKLITEQWYSTGNHSVFWDGKNESGHDLAAGIYFCRLNSSGRTKIQKIVRLR